jgi:mono/diheme cytochrome c family protein
MNVIMKKLNICGVVIIASLLFSNVVLADNLSSIPGECPQQRSTDRAPEHIYNLKNPLEKSESAIKAGENLFLEKSGQAPCMKCHGGSGNGRGIMVSMFDPPPRNFICAKTVDSVPDGQLFWVIKNGSPGTDMPAFDHLSDEQIWQLVHYIRKLSKEAAFTTNN